MSRRLAAAKPTVPDLGAGKSGAIRIATVSRLMPPPDTEMPQGDGKKTIYAGMIYLPNVNNYAVGQSSTSAPQLVKNSNSGIDSAVYASLLNNPNPILVVGQSGAENTYLEEDEKKAFVGFEKSLREWKKKIEADWEKQRVEQQPTAASNTAVAAAAAAPQITLSPVTLTYAVYDAERTHFTRLSVKITPPDSSSESAQITITHRDTKALTEDEQNALPTFEVGKTAILNGIANVFPEPQQQSQHAFAAAVAQPAITYKVHISYEPTKHQQQAETCADRVILTTWYQQQPEKLIEFFNAQNVFEKLYQTNGAVTQDNLKDCYEKLLERNNEVELRAFTQFLAKKQIADLAVVQTQQGLGYFLDLEAEKKQAFAEDVLYAEDAQKNRTWNHNFGVNLQDKLKQAGGYSDVSIDINTVAVTAPAADRLVVEFVANVTTTHTAKPNTRENKKFSVTCDALRDEDTNELTGQVKWTCDLPWKEACAVIAAQSFHMQQKDIAALDQKIDELGKETAPLSRKHAALQRKIEELSQEIKTLETEIQRERNMLRVMSPDPAKQNNCQTKMVALQSVQRAFQSVDAELKTKKTELAKHEARSIKPNEIKIEDIQDGAPKKQTVIDGKTYHNLTEKEAHLIHAYLDAGFKKVHYQDREHDSTPSVLAAPIAATTTATPQPSSQSFTAGGADDDEEEMQSHNGSSTHLGPGSTR